MRLLSSILAFVLVLSQASAQNETVPDRRVVVSQDQDFYGADIRQIFDTTLSACIAACSIDRQCVAFTYNSRSLSCFPKKGIEDRTYFEGAISGILIDTPDEKRRVANSRAADLSFLRPADFQAAYEQADKLYLAYNVGDASLDSLMVQMEHLRSSDASHALLNTLGKAISLTDRADFWTEYASVAQRAKSNNQRQLRHRGFLASVNGYLRAGSAATQTNALLEMARALEATGRGRNSLSALRLAASIQDRRAVTDALVRARSLFGFRVTDTQVANNLASPRLCVIFSSDLFEGRADYRDYVRLSDPKLAIEVSGNQLCVIGADHGTTQTVTLRQGLPAKNGEILSKDVAVSLYVRDRTPSVAFPGRAYVLPKTDQIGLPIETVNTEEVLLSLHEISDRNLLRAVQEKFLKRTISPYQTDAFANEIGNVIWEGIGEVENKLNQTVTTRLNLTDTLKGRPAGVYALRAKTKTQDVYKTPEALQWFIVSDLGLSTAQGSDGLHASVMGLGTAEPLENVEVQVLSRTNRILGKGQTDVTGYVRFDPSLMRGVGQSEPAIITARLGNDLSFLSLTDPEFDLSDRGVEGRDPSGPIDVFLATDRGAYRAGETVFATTLLRDENSLAITGLPMTLVLTRPDGVEHSRHFASQTKAGGAVFQMPIPSAAPRGTWLLDAYVDPKAAPLRSTKFLVEDFLPERLDLQLSTENQQLIAGQTISIVAQSDYLFGAPAANLKLEGELLIRKSDGVDGYDGFQFGLHDRPEISRFSPFPSGIETNENGTALATVRLPETPFDGTPLEAAITARILDVAGRPVERSVISQVTPQGRMIGVKKQFNDDVVDQGDLADFQVVVLGKDSTPIDTTVEWELNKITTRYQWYQQYGNWRWEPTITRKRVDEGTLELSSIESLSLKVDWGEYELLIHTSDGSYVATSTTFFAGWYAPSDTSQTPDTLDVALDKSDYRVGDIAKLSVNSRSPGTALIRVMSDQLLHSQMVKLDAGPTNIPIEITENWGAGAYISATVIREMDIDAGRLPTRALGLVYAKVDPETRQLNLDLSLSGALAPRAPITTTIKVDGIKDGEAGYVTLAAADVGILNVTGFQAPNPSAHYFGQRKLGLGLRDIYGRLIDGLNGVTGTVRSGGDASASLDMQGPPPPEDLVRFFSGPIKLDTSGQAEVTFDVPDFNGSLKFMAIAWSQNGVGQAQKEITLADPVVMSATLPRFLSPNDKSELKIELTHVSGPTGIFQVEIRGTEGLRIAQETAAIALAKNDQKTILVPVSATTLGAQSVSIGMTDPNGLQRRKTIQIGVLRNDPVISRTSRFELEIDDRFIISDDLFSGFDPDTSFASLTVGPTAALDVAGMLQALDQYPYGCTEQITSQAMPLLYLSESATSLGLAKPEEIKDRIENAIIQVLARQTSSGGFGLWRADRGDLWLDAYVADFLTRAQGAGFAVPERAMAQTLNNLRNNVNYAPNFENAGEGLAYALMVLAREGEATISDLRYYADVKANDFATPLALAQLGSALSQYGDQIRADRLFLQAQDKLSFEPSAANLWRTDFGSDLRDTAGLIALANESGSTAIDQTALLRRLSQNSDTRSTQEAAWSLMAARSAATARTGMTFNGQTMESPIVKLSPISAAAEIKNESDQIQTITVTTFGKSNVPPMATGNGYSITRAYYTLDGLPAQTQSVPIGQRLVTVLTVQPFGNQEGRLMVDDPLPAGFEIDNPNLLRAGDVKSLNWLKLSQAQFTQARSDKYLAAVDHRGDKAFQLAYIVRATRVGDYHHPAAAIEDMYRPNLRANSASGRVLVTR